MNKGTEIDLYSMSQIASWQFPGKAGTAHDVKYHLLDGQQRANSIAVAYLVPPMPRTDMAASVDDVGSDANMYGQVVLPSLQRGSVWKPRQIEYLWDSLLRGFPVGTFLLSEKGGRQGGERKFRFDSADVPAALWIDLAGPREEADRRGRRHIFRLITRSHPWGYRRAEPEKPLRARQMRKALTMFKKFGEQSDQNAKTWRQGKIPLEFAWPIEAKAPIPFWMLLHIAREKPDDLWSTFLATLEGFAAKWSDPPEWLTKATNWLKQPDDHSCQYLRELEGALKKLQNRKIPALIMPSKSEHLGDISEDIEELFVRTNAAGTPLAGEELIYSLIKSAWPDADELVEEICHESGVMTPSRLVMMCVRLVQAESSRHCEGEPTPPRVLSVAEFRRQMPHGMLDLLKTALNEKRLGKALRKALEMLRLDSHGCDYRLPGVLATQIARKSQDVFFLALAWCWWYPDAQLNKDERLRVVGAMLVLHWYAESEKSKFECIKRLWPVLCKGEAFWMSGMLAPCLGKDSQGDAPLGRAFLPGEIELALAKHIDCDWRDWQWEAFGNEANSPGEDGGWGRFVHRTFWNKELLLYGQREWLQKWFDYYDPSGADQLEDMNRPWDFDHVLADSYVSYGRGIPRVVRDWYQTIGNYRAWPMDANRSDSDESPTKKFKHDELTEDEKESYGWWSGADMRASSLVTDECWHHLQSIDDSPDFSDRNDTVVKKAMRMAAMQAISLRTAHIYRLWYETLQIGELFNANGAVSK